MADKDLKALFLHQLKDTYFAETAMLKALPQMADAAQAEELKGAFAVHLKETEGHVKRLEQVFQLLGEKPAGVECKAIQGIIEEGQEIVQEFSGGRGSRRRADCRRPSGGALRNHPLRHPAGMGQAAWPHRGGGAHPGDLDRGREHGPNPF